MCLPKFEVINIFLKVTSVLFCHHSLENLRIIRKHLDTACGNFRHVIYEQHEHGLAYDTTLRHS